MQAFGLRAALVVLSLTLALPAAAQDPISISVAPFGDPHGRAGSLSQELELELELDEDLLVLPFSEVKGALGKTKIAKAPDKKIFKAMSKAGVKVLVRGLPDDEEKKLLILMYNGPDQTIILAKTVNITEHLGKAAALAQTLADTARDYDVVDEVSSDEVEAAKQALAGRRIAGGDGDGDAGDGDGDTGDGDGDAGDGDGDRTSGDGDTGDGDGDRTSGDGDTGDGDGDKLDDTATDTTKRDNKTKNDKGKDDKGRLEKADENKGKDDKDDDEVYIFDRIARFTLRYAPPFVSYSSCQPSGGPTPFMCQSDIPAQGATILPWLNPASLGFSLELTPWIRWVGVQLDGSVYRTVLPLSPAGAWFTGSDNDPDAPLASGTDAIEVRGGDFNIFASAQGAFAFGIIGVSVGGRAGFLVNVALVEEHVVAGTDAGGNTVTYPVTVLPTFVSVNPAIGAHGAFFVGRWVRLSANLDVTPIGYQVELPTSIGQSTPTLATHGKLQIDVDPIFGIVLSAFVDGVAVSVRGQGPGTRIHRDLERFANGQADLFVLKTGVGVGYHF
jgi:hypothetical protein